MPEAFHSSGAEPPHRRSSPESRPSSRWSVHARRTLIFVVLSLTLHLTAGVTMKYLGGREEAPRDFSAPEEPVEFEVFEPATEFPEAPDTADAPPPEEMVEAEAPEDQAPAEEEPPSAPSPQNIVELPEGPEETPDDPDYLAERDMRADEQTIARDIGEATNVEEGGDAEEIQAEEADTTDAAEDVDESLNTEPDEPADAEELANAPDAGDLADVDDSLPAEEAPETEPASVEDLEDSEIALHEQGEVPVASDPVDRDAGQPEPPEEVEQPSQTAPGGGRRSLMPSQEQLARAARPAQRNLIEEQRGDVTLLNAQSSEMAAYIIERAKKIYSYLNINSPLTTIYYEDVENLTFPVTLEARIERDGSIASLETIRSSGSSKIDRLVIDAMRSGLHGRPLPPEEAFGDTDRPMRFRFALHSNHIEAGTP